MKLRREARVPDDESNMEATSEGKVAHIFEFNQHRTTWVKRVNLPVYPGKSHGGD